MTANSPTLGQRLKQARAKSKLKQNELARRIGRPKSAVCEWEGDVREPSLSTLRDLARELGCSITSLLK